ncbi:hypothetical protein ACIRL2_24825 [Embleya sp. NPDC127516]|uniref:hypothetical protein n=1 Tax=Embleya sp. NPDC127516 TaxID=3363990 RepID=UPI0037F9F63D
MSDLTLDQLAKGDALPTFGVDVTATTVILGALASRDWRPMHHDYKFAVERQGVQDIFLNTPNQAAWFERYLNDWTGPKGRIGRMVFRMTKPVFPGDHMLLTGTVDDVSVDEAGCGWVRAEISLTVDGAPRTTATARMALPTTPDDNPWDRRGERWKP